MDKLKMHSPNLVDQNIDKLAQLFPNCITEAKGEDGKLRKAIDFDQLKQELSRNIVEGPQERYQLNWPGKREALLTANAPIAKTLRPCREESVNFDTTENLFIEGDNLDALKLLQETYLGKIKMIYIDPPYNTGGDLIYNDDFSENTEIYKLLAKEIDVDGNHLVTNNESNGRFHSDWLSMMYSRLKLAKNLLTPDGLLAISIDDNEIDNLCKVLDELFGDGKRKVICVKMSEASGVKMSSVNEQGTVAKLKEYLVLVSPEGIRGLSVEKIKKNDWDKEYNIFIEGLSKEDRQSISELSDGREVSASDIEKLDYIAKKVKLVSVAEKLKQQGIDNTQKSSWLFDNSWCICQCATSSSVLSLAEKKKETTSEELFFVKSATGKVYFVRGSYDISSKKPRVQLIFADDNLMVHPGDIWIDIKTTGLEAEGGVSFKNGKKPLKLLNRILKLKTNKNDLVMDFFAGSGSFPHAVFEHNKQERKNLRFIAVQLNESFNPKNKDHKQSYDFCIEHGLKPNVAELSKERIRRVIAENQNDLHNSGFRVLKIDHSNMTEVYYKPDAITQADLFAQVDNVKEDRTEEDLLFQVMLDWGVDLTLPIRRETIDGKTVFFIADNALVACFDKSGNITESFVKQLAQFEPMRLVFRDAGFTSDSTKINVEQVLKQLSPTTEVKSI
ncbi:site-specific DNA-methyltransferase [Photobacterium damselae]